MVVCEAQDQTGDVRSALVRAAAFLPLDARRAEMQATAILDVVPGHPEAALYLGEARRRQGKLLAALQILKPLAAAQPRASQVHHELALTLASLGDGPGALASFEQAMALKPGLAEGWRPLGDALFLAGCTASADAAYARHILSSVNDPILMKAAAALVDDRLAVAEQLLREHLKHAPTDVAAIRMLAETGTRLGRYADAEALLIRCLTLAPGFVEARRNYAIVLYRQNKAAEALVEIEHLLLNAPKDPGYRNLQAAALGLTGEYARSVKVYEAVLVEHPNQPKGWLSYGHALKTAGRSGESIDAYKRSLALNPAFGEAWWSLANLKTFRFNSDDVASMEAALAGGLASEDDRLHLHYALGKAQEDANDYAGSFAHYAAGASIRRGQIEYDAAETTAHLDRAKVLFTPAFFAKREGMGCTDEAPIFVLGLPRSGSTLIEQILASHSAVEGTMELPEIVNIARSLGRGTEDEAYPAAIGDLDALQLKALGEQFIERTRIHRKLGRRFFIDKMPNNVLHIGLIHAILPNAKIIDARRHPLATCFSGFKQHFARGQHFSYDLGDIGGYYRDYVALMDHFDTVLPGRIHRVLYEDMVVDTEGEVRRILDYCGLPFEDSCLKFYENERAVRTASSEQVRRPIFTEGLDQWRNYEPWLEPLKAALGTAFTATGGTGRATARP